TPLRVREVRSPPGVFSNLKQVDEHCLPGNRITADVPRNVIAAQPSHRTLHVPENVRDLISESIFPTLFSRVRHVLLNHVLHAIGSDVKLRVCVTGRKRSEELVRRLKSNTLTMRKLLASHARHIMTLLVHEVRRRVVVCGTLGTHSDSVEPIENRAVLVSKLRIHLVDASAHGRVRDLVLVAKISVCARGGSNDSHL